MIMQLRTLYKVWRDNRSGNQADVALNLLKRRDKIDVEKKWR